MKRCEHCNVDVNTTFDTCPLCFRELKNVDDTECDDIFKKKKPRVENKQKTILMKTFLFLSIIASSVSVVINFFVGLFPMWSLIVVLSILYVWILVCHTILSRRGIFEKILLQIGTIIGLLYVCEWVSNGSNWMVNFVIPSISIAVILVLFILAESIKNHKGILSFFVMIFVFIMLSMFILIFKGASFRLLHYISLIEGTLALVGILIFNWQNLKTEFGKIFHV